MSETLAQTELDPVSPSIEAGDRAAATGEWVQAIAIWERLLASPHRLAANERIRWFLDESTTEASVRGFDPERRFDRRRLLLASLVCAMAGTVCVFIGQEQLGAARNVLAALAWVLYVTTATLVVTYAFASGPSLHRDRDRPGLTESELLRAREIASSLSSTTGHPVRHPWPITSAVRRYTLNRSRVCEAASRPRSSE